VKMDATRHFDAVFTQLKTLGFLLLSDPKLPSVCSVITGGPLRTSWWSHPLAQTIFQISGQLEDHPDVTVTKLISGKITYVHRIFWSHIYIIGTSRERWQIEPLSANARVLLKKVDKQGSLRTDKIGSSAKGPAAELEKRLLVNSAQVHTETGAHAKFLESWKHWSERKEFKSDTISSGFAKETFEQHLSRLNREFSAQANLPWQ